MDRTIPVDERRRRRVRRAILPAVIVAALLAGGVYAIGFTRPNLDRAALRTDTARREAIAATIGGVGTVVPRDEQIIVSPVDSRVTRVLHRAGSTVRTGEPIVMLDDANVRAELARLDDRIALKQNEMARARLVLEETLLDLRTQARIKRLELESFTFEVQRNRKLLAKGLVTLDVLRRSQADSARTTIELERIDRRVLHEERALAIDVEGVELEVGMLQDERADTVERMRRATAPATRDGIVTWVIPREGTAVQKGTELARVADLGSFAVQARVAATHAEAVREGQVARVRVGEVRLPGRVERIEPTIAQGAFVVDVSLDEPDHPSLRHNARVDVEIVVEEHPRTTVVRRGAVVRHDGHRYVFVIEGDRAVRTEIVLGIGNVEEYEIVEGVQPGDEVVLTDLTRHAHNREIVLR